MLTHHVNRQLTLLCLLLQCSELLWRPPTQHDHLLASTLQQRLLEACSQALESGRGTTFIQPYNALMRQSAGLASQIINVSCTQFFLPSLIDSH